MVWFSSEKSACLYADDNHAGEKKLLLMVPEGQTILDQETADKVYKRRGWL